MHYKWSDDNVNDDDIAIHEHVQCALDINSPTINSFMQKWYRNERTADWIVNRAQLDWLLTFEKDISIGYKTENDVIAPISSQLENNWWDLNLNGAEVRSQREKNS